MANLHDRYVVVGNMMRCCQAVELLVAENDDNVTIAQRFTLVSIADAALRP
nr:hypothetical protein [Microbacterium sp. SORGH_AS_0888]